MEDYNPEQTEVKILNELSKLAEKSSLIKPELYSKYAVKRGLRDLDGKGVLVGLTEIGEVHSYILDEGGKIPTYTCTWSLNLPWLRYCGPCQRLYS